jgi:hypothetical protein
MFKIVFAYNNNPENQQLRFEKILNFLPIQNMNLSFKDKAIIRVVNITYLEEYGRFLVAYDFV